MNQKHPLPSSPLISNLYILSFFSLLTKTALCAVDKHFEACVPKSCGDGQNISFPFYIRDVQESYCGFPGFEVTCSQDYHPLLQLSNTQYIVHQIFYNNQTLRLSNVVFSVSESDGLLVCLHGPQNLTLPPEQFHLAPNQRKVTLFYGCNSSSLHETPLEDKVVVSRCSENHTNSSVVGFYEEEKPEFLSNTSTYCTGGVANSTVEGGGGGLSWDGGGGIGEALRRGFLLKWIASNCSDCSRSGGRCGFDADSYHFKCYCPDRPHAWQCAHGPSPG